MVVETVEEERAMRLLERVAGKAERKVQTWSLASGLDGSGQAAGDFALGVQAMEQAAEPTALGRARCPRGAR